VEYDPSNMRPAHGSPGNICAKCGAACNQVRGMGSIERCQRILAEEYGVTIEPVEQPVEDGGRPW
jgi:hypothetical protein